MKSFKQFIKESSYKLEDGEIIAHHATPYAALEGGTFRSMSHFGSAPQARDRAQGIYDSGYLDKDDNEIRPDKMFAHTVKIKLGNVARVGDPREHHPSDLVRILKRAGHFTQEDENSLGHFSKWTHQGIANLLNKKGIDTLVYKNEYEGNTESPNNDSYIVTNPSKQVKVLQSTPANKPGGANLNLSRNR
jgi:hypothetical protein